MGDSGQTRSNGPEHPNHYADIDAEYPPHGTSLRELCRSDPKQFLTVDAWQTYYADMAKLAKSQGDEDAARQYSSKLKQGLLPFRLWQFFDAMTELLKAGDIEGFVTAAGTAAHYMGDASQPLHGSVLADGEKSRPGPRNDPKTGEALPYGDGVHSAYETNMVSRFADDLLPKAKDALAKMTDPLPLCKSGSQVARATIELMHSAAETLLPTRILDAFEEEGGNSNVATLGAMYDALAVETASVLAEGARYLALLWDSAWVAGGGASVHDGDLEELDPKAVRARYINTAFVPSLTLDEITAELKNAGPGAEEWP